MEMMKGKERQRRSTALMGRKMRAMEMVLLPLLLQSRGQTKSKRGCMF